MKKYIFSICALALMCFTTSCSDFLDEDPKGKLAQDNFFSSQEDLDMSVNALYNLVCGTGTNTNPTIPAWAGDDLTTHPASNKQAYAQYVNFAPSDDNKGSVAVWSVYYKLIKAANYIIMNADKTPVSETEINIAKGQAYYWRAVSYFQLVRTFGDIPMNLDNTIDVTVVPTEVSKIYDQIISDLEAAIAVLPTSYSKTPRQWEGVACWITKQAATATLSSVYLNRAGWPLNGGKADYEKAASYAKTVIDGCNSGTYEYKLQEKYSYVYSMSHNYNTETVVGINASRDFSWSQDTEMGVSNIFESQGGWGDAWGTYRFWKEFPEGDRKDATYMPKIMVLVGPYKGTLVDFYEKDGSGNYYIAEKHPAFQIFCCSGNGTADFDYTYAAGLKIDAACTSQRRQLIRYSEVLLWYAEASARAAGSINSQALECLNKVRERAGEAKVAAGDFKNADEFAELCFKEHGWEVAGYFVSLNTRRMDVQRMNMFKQVYDNRKADKLQGYEVAPGVVLKEDLGPEGTFSESVIYAPLNNTDKTLNPNLK